MTPLAPGDLNRLPLPGQSKAQKATQPAVAGASVDGVGGAAPTQPLPPVAAQPSVGASAPRDQVLSQPAPAYVEQLSKPIFTLAAAGNGEQVVTVKVTPENLGPVTVLAHVGPDGLRVELFAPTDAGRDAIRSILSDLRRDLASQGLTANLDLSTQNQPGDPGAGGRGAGSDAGGGAAATRQAPTAAIDRTAAPIEPAAMRIGLDGSTSILDVMV